MDKEYVKKEVIENQLLVALDDKSKVGILASEDDLSLLIVSLERSQRYAPCNQKRELLDGLIELMTSAFRPNWTPQETP